MAATMDQKDKFKDMCSGTGPCGLQVARRVLLRFSATVSSLPAGAWVRVDLST